MNTRVITITRQFGSLGRPIGKNVAEAMGFEYFDRDIIEKAAEEMGEPVGMLSDIDERMFSNYGRMMFPLGSGLQSKQKRLFEIEKKVILNLAGGHDCVIIGRCSDCIMHEAGVQNVYSVFVYAPYTSRFNNCLRTLGLTPEAAEVYIDKVDAAREKYYEEYTGEKFESLKYRDIMLDSSAMPLEDSVKIICEGARLKFAQSAVV
jgi:cytidylate kinase